VVPACGNGLEDETCFLEVLRVRALPEFISCKAIAVSRECLLDRLKGVRRVQPCVGVEVLLDILDLLVNSFGDEQVDAVDEILDKALQRSARLRELANR
jgi:hypothetical protein